MANKSENAFFEFQAGFLAFRGDKSAQLLHGQLTNDIKGLQAGSASFNLLLNQKGKVRAALYVFNRGDLISLLVEPQDKTLLLDHFSRMAPLSRVEIEDQSAQYRYFHVIASEPDLVPGLLPVGGLLFRTDRMALPGLDAMVPAGLADEFVGKLAAAGFPRLDETSLEALRVEQGVARMGTDFLPEEHLPQESRLDGALHFNKGCYLGQEIIARLHYKGHVNKILKTLLLSGAMDFKPGQKLISEDKEVGVITSVAQTSEGIKALGYVPYKSSEPGTTFQVAQAGTATILT